MLKNVHITGLGASGEGVASLEGYRLFVDGALPGEEVVCALREEKKTYAKAETVDILKRSPERRDPPCPYYGSCGGCQLQHLSYEGQLAYKRQKVLDALQRIGKLEGILVDECVPSPQEFGYRNKIQLPVEEGKVGLYRKGSHELIDIEACLLHCPLGEEVYKAIRPLAAKAPLRALLVKSAGEGVLVTLVAKSRFSGVEGLAQEIMDAHPKVQGVVLCLNNKTGNALLDVHFERLAGKERILETLCGLKFFLSSASFFQVNPAQAENLYRKALEFAELKGSEFVVDAYCGVGTLALIFAQQAKKVLGIECVSQAIDDARENCRENGISNAEFKVGRAEFELPKLREIDVLLLNPPRKGVDSLVIEAVAKSLPKKILYVSCDPATLARDSRLLCDLGYRAGVFTPFDMFPQTSHVETLVCFTR